MNYFTGTYTVSLFPRATFIERRMYATQEQAHNADVHADWKGKYQDRGYTIATAFDQVHSTPELRSWRREVGDGRTWVLPFKRGRTFFNDIVYAVLILFQPRQNDQRSSPIASSLKSSQRVTASPLLGHHSASVHCLFIG